MIRKKPLIARTMPSQPKRGAMSSVRQGLGVLWRAFKKTCFMLGFLSLIYMVVALFMLARFDQAINAPAPSLPDEMVLFLDLEGQIAETPQSLSLLGAMQAELPPLRTLIDSLNEAAGDERVKALYVRMRGFNAALSQVQELRQALKNLQSHGKTLYVYANSYEGGIGRFYLASLFDERWMPPMGVVSMEGLRVEMPFFRQALNDLGVTPDFHQRKEYKTAYESLTNTQMSAPNRRAMQTVVDTISTTVAADMAQDLQVEPEALDNYVDMALFTAQEAAQNNLITHLGYPDEIFDKIKADITGSVESSDALFVPLEAYHNARLHHKEAAKPKKTAALIYVTGAIVETNENGQDNVAAASDIAPAIWNAAEDKRIDVIVLRIDSPGGSPIASDTILHAIKKAQEKGKKVIVSMGSMAASGGYWVASGADYIYAMPTTLTGSIGVLGGKIALQDMWAKLDVRWDHSIKWGENAGIWSVNTPFSPAQKRRVDAMLDQIYDGFIERVSQGRALNPPQVEKIARGRVWPGLNAKQNGLVDALGGLRDTLTYTAQDVLGLESLDQMRVVVMPKPLSPLEQVVKLLSERGLIYNVFKMHASLGQWLTSAPALEAVSTQVQALRSMTEHPVSLYEPTRLQ